MIPSKQSKECYEMLIGFPLYPGYFIFCTVLLLITRLNIRRNPKRQGDKGNGKDEDQSFKFRHLRVFCPLKILYRSSQIKSKPGITLTRKENI